MKYALLFLLMIQVFSPYKQSSEIQAKSAVFKGYCQNDRTAWEQGIAAMRRGWEKSSDQPALLFDLIQSEYGFIGFRLAKEEEGLDEEIDRLIGLTEKLDDYEQYRSHAEAFRGALYAIKIGLKPIRALGLGPKSEKALNRALELDPENPYAWVEMGNMRYHAPGLFGGSHAKAILCFQKAVDLFDQNPEQKAHNWQYLHALCWMGLAYEEEDQLAKAKDSYEKALDFAPDFFWAKEELLPDVQRKL